MNDFYWLDQLPAAVTVCDRAGIIIFMNQTSREVFASDGGGALVGKSIYDCHSERSAQMIKSMMDQNQNHVYTIQKKGRKKMIYQTPYLIDGVVSGMVEITFEIPEELPHFNRD